MFGLAKEMPASDPRPREAAATVTWNADGWYGFPEKPFEVDFIPLVLESAHVDHLGRALESIAPRTN